MALFFDPTDKKNAWQQIQLIQHLERAREKQQSGIIIPKTEQIFLEFWPAEELSKLKAQYVRVLQPATLEV